MLGEKLKSQGEGAASPIATRLIGATGFDPVCRSNESRYP
jgi:hypothetical protein